MCATRRNSPPVIFQGRSTSAVVLVRGSKRANRRRARDETSGVIANRRLTRVGSCSLGFGVRRIFSLIACVLAVLWLPATLHCGLESAGLLAHEHEAGAVESGCAETCHNDSCAMVEEGGYKASTRSLSVPVPLLATLWLERLIAPPAATQSPPVVSPETTDSPPELVRTWQFTARTALLPGAPWVLV